MGLDAEPTDRPLRADARRNRGRILAAASEVFAEIGLEASLDQIAERAGVGVGTVYRRFPDKDTLIDELFEERLSEVVATAEECAAMEDAWTGLTTFIERGSHLMGRNYGLRQLMQGPGLNRSLMERPRALLSPLVGSMVERAKASGDLRSDFETLDVPQIEVMISHLIDLTGTVAPDTWRRFMTMIFDGMRTENASTPLPVPGLTPDQYFAAVSGRSR